MSTETDKPEATERVSMIWPADMKAKVRAQGETITDFVLDAVEVHLGVAQDLGQTIRELDEVKYFAQTMADQLVLGGSSEDRHQFLMELEFPSWIDTSGWPSAMAERVHPATPEPEPASEQVVVAEVISVEERRGTHEVTEQELKGVMNADRDKGAHPATPAPKPAGDMPPPSDLLARIRAKAAEKGVDLHGVDLKPASEVAQPAPRDPEPAPEPVVPVIDVPAIDTLESGVCPICKDELVDGECWTCG